MASVSFYTSIKTVVQFFLLFMLNSKPNTEMPTIKWERKYAACMLYKLVQGWEKIEFDIK